MELNHRHKDFQSSALPLSYLNKQMALEQQNCNNTKIICNILLTSFNKQALRLSSVLLTKKLKLKKRYTLASRLKKLFFFPKKRKLYTVLRSPHIYKCSREQLSVITYKACFKISTNRLWFFKLLKFLNFVLKKKNFPNVKIQFKITEKL